MWSNFTEGQKFHRWTILMRDVSLMPRTRYYIVKCDCGVFKSVRAASLSSGGSKSCGCLALEVSRRKRKPLKENLARTNGTLPYFKSNTWSNIHKRVVNSKSLLQRNAAYIKKGIKLLMTKDEFYKFCDDNKEVIMQMYSKGIKPSLDRIDSNGHYVIGNIQILSLSDNCRKSLIDKTDSKV